MTPCFRWACRAGLGAALWLHTLAWPATQASTLPAALAPSHTFATEQVRIELLSEQPDVRPGQRLTLGLHQRIAPDWHTYWRNPGDSGAPTTVQWQLPAGTTAGAIQWPMPSRFTLDPVVNYGYQHEVTLLTELHVPTDLSAGQRFEVRAQVAWLVCHDLCIPQRGEVALSLPVVAAHTPATPGHPLIQAARALLPQPAPWPVPLSAGPNGQVVLALPDAARDPQATLQEAWFYPHESGLLDHSAPQSWRTEGATTHLVLPVGETPPRAGEPLAGTLVLTERLHGQERRRAYDVAPAWPVLATAPEQAQGVPAAVDAEPALSLAPALLLAFLGGLVLNLMPCVFPVLSIKALSLFGQGPRAQVKNRLQGLAYTGGVLASFVLLALLLVGLKAGGAQLGWGFQFQSPVFVLAVAYLMLALGLNLSGVFEVGGSVSGLGSGLAERGGYSGSFFTGVLATVVATPCTAPFMGGAIGFALAQPTAILLAVFLTLGLGLATPYLVLSWWPALQRWLPRPGPWMLYFKQVLAFPMYAAAAWLVWVLAQQVGVNAAGTALLGAVGIGFAAWVYNGSRHAGTGWRRTGSALTVLALAGVLGASHSAVTQPPSPSANPAQAWESYSASRLEVLRAQGQPVFLNLTAAWCITCLANERVVLSQAEVLQAFKTQGVTYLKGDWTNQDPAITALLARFGRSGVPLYVYYPPGAASTPQVLPQLLTRDTVLSLLPGNKGA
ncbi:MAG TPA: protein-disulfide reductase DsbD domain-containing protein [Burkholderiaceae bacterium]|nr:protein-disulfide reductase DsbD domain-containing protein [Burkholderiaceae bacterium]